MRIKGAVACGHIETARAAEMVLKEGGNAFDAIIAAFLASCVAEPVLASLGGGGFMLAHRSNQPEVIYDFFAQTPVEPVSKAELDFYPIHADFGATTQEFHIGLASIATPGAIKGIYKIYEDLCTMPMKDLMQPAIDAARGGIEVNRLQASIFRIIAPILLATPESKDVYQSKISDESLIVEGERLIQTHFADFLEVLANEGDDLFYKGEIAHAIHKLSMQGGGQIGLRDLEAYEVILRKPVITSYKHNRVITNPAPSCGGTLIAFALSMLEHMNVGQFDYGSEQHLGLLAHVMKLTNEARFDTHASVSESLALQHLLDDTLLHQYHEKIAGNTRSLRGTTHMSVIDGKGNVAALTASNGEGCGHMIPDTGVMLNNMLGEEDLNPDGFYGWPANQRMTSMMAPSLVISPEGKKISLGSGGSNRLRTAILQVLINILDFGLPLDKAINHPRIHFENDLLNIEPGFNSAAIAVITNEFASHKLWHQQNLFFGGVHAVTEYGGDFDGAGDQRRGGVASIVH